MLNKFFPFRAGARQRLKLKSSRKFYHRACEKFFEFLLFLTALTSVLVTVGIASVLIVETIPFFREVSFWDFITDPEWTPLFSNAHFGIRPLLSGTLVTTFIALVVAIPVGSVIAIYLSEYAPLRAREVLKPMLELLSAIPTVVYGYFALLFVSPMLQKIFPELPGFNMLSAGIVMGVMIIPYVSSLSEDAMRAVPMHMREGSYAMGATKLQTALNVVVPSAFSGISAAYVLAVSRAFGETMIVAIAAGMQPNLTLNPAEPASTITAYIVQVSLGDLPHGSLGYRTIFAAGLTLLVFTFGLNILGHTLKKRFGVRY
jgi:phosphate transport system permease protein